MTDFYLLKYIYPSIGQLFALINQLLK